MKTVTRLAPLNGLRAFEAAARRMSFAAAAEELYVTPGAISHQIAALEDFLGIKLFRRGSRGVVLTSAAEACVPLLTQAFATLHEAVALLDPKPGVRPLTVHVAPGLATRWLLPRLASFTAMHPEIELRVSTGQGLIDAVRQESAGSPIEMTSPDANPVGAADLAIRFGRGTYVGFVSERLFEAEITPVCSPRMLLGTSRSPADDLRRSILLHADTAYFDAARGDWAVWLEAAGIEGVDALRGSRFSHTGLALDAAEDGLGFALGITALTAADIASGRLVAPFASTLRSTFSYYLVHDEAIEDQPDLKALRTWLRTEASGLAPGAAGSSG